MLFLQLPAEASTPGQAPVLPIDDATGLAFERALLQTDRTARLAELSALLAADAHAAQWALRTVEHRRRQTVNHVDEAAAWLCDRLANELFAAIKPDVTAEERAVATNEINWRLPRLVAVLNAAHARTADFEHRLERAKLESLKELAYGASHEINNPLANIAARAQTLLTEETDPERRRALAAIHRQAMRAHEMIADLMLFARPPKLACAPCDLNALVQKVVSEFAALAQEHSIQLAWECRATPLEVWADETQLGVAIAAVVKNACEAVRDGGHISVVTRRTAIGANNWVEVAIEDDGPGISTDARQHLFDPFYSGREAGRGLGFGLSKCWRIVTDHGGKVAVAPRLSGAEVSILLSPNAAPEASAP